MTCSLARTLNLIGEWWTPLILRDIFLGIRRFEPLLNHLGISRNILADRLQTLVENHIVERRPYQQNPERFEYVLTERGVDLFPIIAAVMSYGDKWLSPGGVPTELVHQDCGKVAKATVVCSKCAGELNLKNVRARRGAGGQVEEWEAIRTARMQSMNAEKQAAKAAKK